MLNLKNDDFAAYFWQTYKIIYLKCIKISIYTDRFENTQVNDQILKRNPNRIRLSIQRNMIVLSLIDN